MNYEKFIQKMESEHALIRQAFDKLKSIIDSGSISDTAFILTVVEQLKSILTVHLKDEDNLFYPDMRKKAVELKQEALLPALDIFIGDMKGISKRVFNFFTKYNTEKAISANEKVFINGIVEIRDALIKRIDSEEKTLYYIYKAYHDL